MKLYELMKMSMGDYDTYDTVYDACVTVCCVDDEDLDGRTDDFVSFDKFCNELIKKVEVVQIIPDSHLVCDWSKLIHDNMEKFRAFAKENWYENCQYEDDEDEFIYQWINEIHYYIAGYVSEDFYDKLVELVETLKA